MTAVTLFVGQIAGRRAQEQPRQGGNPHGAAAQKGPAETEVRGAEETTTLDAGEAPGVWEERRAPEPKQARTPHRDHQTERRARASIAPTAQRGKRGSSTAPQYEGSERGRSRARAQRRQRRVGPTRSGFRPLACDPEARSCHRPVTGESPAISRAGARPGTGTRGRPHSTRPRSRRRPARRPVRSRREHWRRGRHEAPRSRESPRGTRAQAGEAPGGGEGSRPASRLRHMATENGRRHDSPGVWPDAFQTENRPDTAPMGRRPWNDPGRRSPKAGRAADRKGERRLRDRREGEHADRKRKHTGRTPVSPLSPRCTVTSVDHRAMRTHAREKPTGGVAARPGRTSECVRSQAISEGTFS